MSNRVLTFTSLLKIIQKRAGNCLYFAKKQSFTITDMNRLSIIKTLMQQKKLKNYLEIGVFNGRVFFRVKSSFKIAVDPEFIFDGARKAGKLFTNPYNLFNKYIQKTSDDFFAQDAASLFAEKKVQLALIDGMHEYSFVLRDVENTLKYLSDDGVIIMHDCNPQTKEEAGSFEEWQKKGSVGQWNGDVWKSILHLQSLRDDINVFVLDCDHGLGIITKRKPENKLHFSQEEIKALTYEDFNANRQNFLNLKPAGYFYEFFQVK
jgi:Methyltransferase domain